MFFQPRNLRGAGVGRARRTAWPSRYRRGVQIVENPESANLTRDAKTHPACIPCLLRWKTSGFRLASFMFTDAG